MQQETPNPGAPPPVMAPNPQGSITKGVLLNVGMNLFICLIWVPLCGLGGNYNSDNLASNLGVVFFFAGLGIGVTQLIHVVPLGLYLHAQEQKATLKGVVRAALVTFAVWAVVALGFFVASW